MFQAKGIAWKESLIIQPLIHWLGKYLLSKYYVPNTDLNATDTVVKRKKKDLHPCLHEADILAGDRQQMCYMSVYIACVLVAQ